MKISGYEKIISAYGKARILVIGDLILDEYIQGKVDRISPEAPVPVIWAEKHSFVPGGAANVAYNISALDAEVCLAGVVGADKNAAALSSALKERGVDVSGIVRDPRRHTTVKTRIIAGHQQVVRVDWEHTHPLSAQMNKKILDFVAANIDGFSAVIIEDYGKGVVNSQLLSGVLSLAGEKGKIVNVDPKEEHFQLYRKVTSITPNRRELENAVRNLKLTDTTNKFKIHSDKIFTLKEVTAAAEQVMRYLELESILVTMGEQGMALFEKDGGSISIPTVAQEVFDVSGAGDTVIAAFTLALACGAKKAEAAHIANFAAGIVVSKLGTAVTGREELLRKIKECSSREVR
ncbi:MAG: D-glycero-beta-D-manno-heptose-7-phosphate kinase [Candidatus Omnitrophota bacterium]|jgi:D-beta-D-heptose 7-phosphate kinase/D-beta-D-heptose 1-phosphate adenosyltransferase